MPEEYKNKFLTLLKDNFYVPVLRAEDNCSEPVIGDPFSPTSPPVSCFVLFRFLFVFKSKSYLQVHNFKY